MNNNILSKLEVKKIDVTRLTRQDFSKALVDKYFQVGNTSINRFHLPEINKRDYLLFVLQSKNIKSKENLNFETASAYYKDLARKSTLANALGTNVKNLDFSNYIWDEDLYKYSNLFVAMQYQEDLFRDQGKITYQEPNMTSLDTDTYDKLEDFIYKVIKNRYLMLLEVEPLVGLLNNILEYTNGNSTNATESMNSAMKGMLRHYEKLCSDKSTVEFLKSNNDFTIYGMDSDTRKDYIDSYRKVLRMLTSIRHERLDYCRDFIHQDTDIYEELILSDEDIEVISEDYLDDGDLDDEYYGTTALAE